MVAMGVIFEMPAVVLVLARMGSSPRIPVRQIKYAILLIFIFAAVITRPGIR